MKYSFLHCLLLTPFLVHGIYKCDTECKVCHLFDYEADGCNEVEACEKGWHCVECNEGLILWFDRCLPPCGTGFYRSGFECKLCTVNCAACTGPLDHECVSCKNNFQFDYRGLCVKECPSNQFADFVPIIGSTKCLSCHPSCDTCISPWTSSCTSCREGTTLRIRHTKTKSGECLDHCREGYFRDSPGDFKCIACSDKCAACTSSTVCTRCETGYFLFPQVKKVWGYYEYPDRYCLKRDELGVFSINEVPTMQFCGEKCDADSFCVSFEWKELSPLSICTMSSTCDMIFSQPIEGTVLFIKGAAQSIEFAYCYSSILKKEAIIDISSYLGDVESEAESTGTAEEDEEM